MIAPLISTLVLSSLLTIGNSNLSISTVPTDARVKEGDDLIIICSHPSFAVSLFINMQDATGNSRVYLVPAGMLSNITYVYSSIYRTDRNMNFSCQSTQGGGIFSEVITLEVLFAPTLSAEIMDVSGVEGGSATLTFSVDANPLVTASDISISPTRSPTPSVSVDDTDVTVMFTNLQRSDAANYTVQVTNSVDSISSAFQLDVFFGPDFSNSSMNIAVTEGGMLTIDCRISATKPPVTSIMLNGTRISESLNISNPVFVLNAVTIDYNGLLYTCTATNGQTTNRKMFCVTVIARPTSTSSSSSQSDSSSTPEPTNVEEGSDGLSDGAIGGIAAACLVIAILIVVGGVGVGVCVYWSKKDAAKA